MAVGSAVAAGSVVAAKIWWQQLLSRSLVSSSPHVPVAWWLWRWRVAATCDACRREMGGCGVKQGDEEGCIVLVVV